MIAPDRQWMADVADSFGRAWIQAQAAFRLARSRRDLSRLLRQMDDRALADLGLSRSQAAFEAARSFWDRGGVEVDERPAHRGDDGGMRHQPPFRPRPPVSPQAAPDPARRRLPELVDG